MTKARQKRRRPVRTLTRMEYRQECLRRHPDFREDWESLLLTAACIPDEARAALAGPEETLRSGLAKKWPRLFTEECVMVPLTADTTEEEWLAAYRDTKRRKWGFRRSKKRTHGRELAFRLQVFDAYDELRNSLQVAQRLGCSESNVRRAYNAVYHDVYDIPPPKRIKERRAAGFDPAAHRDSCPTCQKAKTDVKQMCPSARAYMEQDQRALRESLEPSHR